MRELILKIAQVVSPQGEVVNEVPGALQSIGRHAIERVLQVLLEAAQLIFEADEVPRDGTEGGRSTLERQWDRFGAHEPKASNLRTSTLRAAAGSVRLPWRAPNAPPRIACSAESVTRLSLNVMSLVWRASMPRQVHFLRVLASMAFCDDHQEADAAPEPVE